jgi:hypothetical protein
MDVDINMGMGMDMDMDRNFLDPVEVNILLQCKRELLHNFFLQISFRFFCEVRKLSEISNFYFFEMLVRLARLAKIF